MSVDKLIATWRDTRSGFIREVEQIPADQFSFRATPETRSVAELVQHVIEAQKILVGETCRQDSNLRRQRFSEHIKEHAPGVATVSNKEGLLDLLKKSMDEAETQLEAYGDGLNETILGLDGKPTGKLQFMSFIISHEMYHRGQLTVYERLLGIEPELTGRFRKLVAQAAG